MSYLASGMFVDWEEMTGQSKFVIDMVTVPIFSAIAGVLTNWTGVLMLFVPVNFSGFYVPGVKTLFHFLPQKVQVLPVFAPGGILGFQGFIPARSEKMASIVVDKAIYKIATMEDIWRELDPSSIAAHISEMMKTEIRPLVNSLMARENPELWNSLPQQVKEIALQRIEAELPEITQRAFDTMGEHVGQLVDVKLLAVGYLRDNPEILKDVIYGVAHPELNFMIRIGLLGFPFGIFLALWLSFLHYTGPEAKEAHAVDPGAVYISLPGTFDTILHFLPAWLWVLIGAAIIGILVNVICIKMVFTPGEPQPRYKYLWKQAKLAKRQHQASGDLAHALAYKVLTLPVIANEVLNGPRGDKAMGLIEEIISVEMARILGPMKSVTRAAVGGKEFDAMLTGGRDAALELAPTLLEDVDFSRAQAAKVDEFAVRKLRELPPGEFMDMIYSAIEQDAWLLYVHGGLLGILVGAVHIVIFGA